MKTRSFPSFFAGLFASTLLSATALASGGFDSGRIGGERGHAASPTPFAVYYNPAALAGTRKVHLAADLTLALHAASYKRTETSKAEPSDSKGANLGTAKLFDVLAGPSLAGSMRLGDFAVGIGFFAPMSGSMRWKGDDSFKDNPSFPGAQDGAARWHAVQADQKMLYGSAGLSYTIPSIGLSLGAGGNLVYSHVLLTRARTGRSDDETSNEGRIGLDVNGINGSFTAGAMLEILKDKLWLGASYQAPPGLYGGMVLKGTLKTYLGSKSPTEKVELHQSFPDIVRLALRYREPRYELRLFGDYTRWSTLTNQCLVDAGTPCDIGANGATNPEVQHNQVRRWDDTFAVRVGGSYWFTPKWEGFVGAGYDSNAIPDGYLEPSLIDGHDLSLALGGRVLLGERVGLSFSYTHVQTLARDTSGKSRLFGFEQKSKMPSAAGEYTQWLGLFNSMVEVYFD